MDYKVVGLWSIAGLALVFGVCRFLIWRWTAFEGGKYDERQVADQDRAGKTAFAVLLGYLAVIQILRMLDLQFTVETYDSLLWIGILLGIAVYGTITIWTNAYNFVQKKWKTVIFVLLGLAVVHLSDFIDLGYVYRNGTWWQVGTIISQGGIFLHVDYRIKLIVGLVWLYLALLVVIRRKLDERE